MTRTKESISEEEIVEDAQIIEEDSSQNLLDEGNPPMERSARKIVCFGEISSIKKFLLDDSTDEETAVKKIVKKCLDDFVVKCVKIIESFTECPSSVYTYMMFIERFAWIQQDDVTTREGSKEMIIYSTSEGIVNRIYDLYYVKNSRAFNDERVQDLFDSDLIQGDTKKAKDKIKNMFGKNLFPNLIFWYNYNDKDNIWQYAYSIMPPKQSNKNQENRDNGNES